MQVENKTKAPFSILHDFKVDLVPATWEGEIKSEANSSGKGSASSIRYTVPIPVMNAQDGLWDISWKFDYEKGGHLLLTDGDWILELMLSEETLEFVIHYQDGLIISQECLPLSPPSPRVLWFEFTLKNACLKFRVRDDGDRILGEWTIDHPLLRLFHKWFSFVLTGEFCGSRLEANAVGKLSPASAKGKPSKSFFLEHNVDFHGHLCFSHFTHRHFDRLFCEFAKIGIRRVQWIHYGNKEDGLWSSMLDVGREENRGGRALRTMEEVGEIFAAAVSHAAKYGIEIYGLLRPFEGMVYSTTDFSMYPPDSPYVKRLGGRCYMVPPFSTERRDLAISRSHACDLQPQNPFIESIEIIHDDLMGPVAHSVEIEIWASHDNHSYFRLDRPHSVQPSRKYCPVLEWGPLGMRQTSDSRECQVFRIAELRLDTPFIAVKVKSGRIRNSLVNIVRLYGPNGLETKLCFGNEGRLRETLRKDGTIGFEQDDPLQTGFEFGMSPLKEVPSACRPGYNMYHEQIALDSVTGPIGIAMGLDQDCASALSPGFPESRAYWLHLVREILDAGAAGVELRVRNHNFPATWIDLGWETPVLSEYLARGGAAEGSKEAPDLELLRRIRGGFYTQFVRDAARLTRERGKKMGIHIERHMSVSPSYTAAMEIYWDWELWLQEQLADSVTLKEILPGGHFFDTVLETLRERDIPGTCAVYKARTPEELKMRVRKVQESGLAGYQHYLPVVRLDRHANVVWQDPNAGLLRELFQ